MTSGAFNDWPARPVQTDPILSSFWEHTEHPRVAFLLHHNVPTTAFCRDGDGAGEPIGAAWVIFNDNVTPLFDFADEDAEGAVRVFVFVARNRCGDLHDLCAWSPKSEKIASHYGRAAILGEHEINAPRLSGPLVVHRGPLGWLQAGRSGIVIIDPKKAWRAFDGVPVVVDAVAHGVELEKVLTPPKPQILVRNAQHREAA